MYNAAGRTMVPIDTQSQATMKYCVVEKVEQRPGQWCPALAQIVVAIVYRKRMTHIKRCID